MRLFFLTRFHLENLRVEYSDYVTARILRTRAGGSPCLVHEPPEGEVMNLWLSGNFWLQLPYSPDTGCVGLEFWALKYKTPERLEFSQALSFRIQGLVGETFQKYYQVKMNGRWKTTMGISYTINSLERWHLLMTPYQAPPTFVSSFWVRFFLGIICLSSKTKNKKKTLMMDVFWESARLCTCW